MSSVLSESEIRRMDAAVRVLGEAGGIGAGDASMMIRIAEKLWGAIQVGQLVWRGEQMTLFEEGKK